MPATDAVRQKFQAITDRFAAFQAQSLNVHVDFPLLQRLALPINIGTVRYPGIKIHDTRIIRLMEVLLHGSNTVGGSTARQIHQAVLAAFELSPNTYVLNQLRYDLRKLKGHGLLQRDGRRYAYRGVQVALLFLFFHKRLCGPLANSCFHHQPDPHHRPDSKLGGETMLPTVTGDDGAMALSRYWASDAQVNVQYSVGTSARTGQHSLWITTEAGQSNAGTYYVYDATPVVTSISPGVWQAGASTPVTISGTGFGTTPTVSFSDSYVSWTQGTASDTSISGTATVNANDPGGTVTITVTSNGYGSGFQGGTGQAKQGSKTATVAPLTVSQSPGTLNLSTGDNASSGTAKYVTTTVTPSSFSFTPTFSTAPLSNPNSSCVANLSFSTNGGTGSVQTTVTGGPAGCSGTFNATAAVGGKSSSGTTRVTVPPQILIQFLIGEAGGQTGAGDMSQPAIAVSARNRFGDANFPGGTTATYQAVIIPQQYYGATNTTPNGIQPELTNAVGVFTGTTGAIVQSAKCYWSPTAAQWSIVQQALNSQTTIFPANTGAPSCWAGQPRQIIYKLSVANNNRGGAYAGAPAFLFLQQIPQANLPAVIQIP